MKKFYKVEENKLLDLLTAAHTLNALERGGVDNWSWCGESCSDYLKRYNDRAGSEVEYFEDIAELEIRHYEEVK